MHKKSAFIRSSNNTIANISMNLLIILIIYYVRKEYQ